MYIRTANVVEERLDDRVESRDLLIAELLLADSPPQRRHEVVENDRFIQHKVHLTQLQHALLQVPAYMRPDPLIVYKMMIKYIKLNHSKSTGAHVISGC